MENLNQQKNRVYTPSEMIQSMLGNVRGNIPQKVVIDGVYEFCTDKPFQTKSGDYYFYDQISDRTTKGYFIPVAVDPVMRSSMKNGMSVSVTGNLRFMQREGDIKLKVWVTKIDLLEEDVEKIQQDRSRLANVFEKKSKKESKNVREVLQKILMEGKRPSITFLYPTTSVVDLDVNFSFMRVRDFFDVKTVRTSFNAPDLVRILEEEDKNGNDSICIIRGGGEGLSGLDDVTVLEEIVKMETPVISAVGHVKDDLYMKRLVDYNAGTPSHLGEFLTEIADMCSQKLEMTRAREEMKKEREELERRHMEVAKLETENLSAKREVEQAREEMKKKREELERRLMEAMKEVSSVETEKRMDEQAREERPGSGWFIETDKQVPSGQVEREMNERNSCAEKNSRKSSIKNSLGEILLFSAIFIVIMFIAEALKSFL